jgi:hypothetical protein
MKIFVTGGTILSSSGKDGKLEPTYTFKDLLKFLEGQNLEIPVRDFDEEIGVYFIDSQDFDLTDHGVKIAQALEAYKCEDIIVVSGTDTAKWLAKHISNLEKDTDRQVVILSSMYSPECNPKHVANIIKYAADFVQESNKSGVFVVSARNYEGDQVAVFDAKNRLTKIHSSGHGSFVGEFEDKTPQQIQERQLAEFISGSKIKLLPLLAGNHHRNIKEYYKGLLEDDVVIIEIQDSDLNNPNFSGVFRELADRGVKVILQNRYFCDKDLGFQPSVSTDRLLKLQETLAECKNIFVSDLPSNFYADLAYGKKEEFQLTSQDPILYSQHVSMSPIGVRYIPNYQLFSNSLGILQKSDVVFEALVGGVIPRSFLDKFAKEQKVVLSGKISFCPTYPDPSIVELEYQASATTRDLEILGNNVVRFPQTTARETIKSTSFQHVAL